MIDNKKFEDLLKYIRQYPRVAIAFSGGVDSSFLLAASAIAIGKNNVKAIIVDSPALPRYELQDAYIIAENVNVELIVINSQEIEEPVKHNPVDRCYFCKKFEFGSVKEKALELGINVVFDGSNADDIKDYRPGMKATKEIQVLSPLLETGITKEDIRSFSKDLELPTWDKPAYACLYSRIPYGQEIKIEDLARIEKSEKFFIDKGFRTIRVRCHDKLARIEVNSADIEKLLKEPLKSEIITNLKDFGFQYITIDMLGYRVGSFNETMKKQTGN